MLLAMGLGFCAIFAFLVPTGSYLGLVHSSHPTSGPPRRVLDASVAACAASVATLAFRNSLWWVVGATSGAAGSAQLATLLGCAIAVTFVIVASGESLLRLHSRRP
jgi:hypothetical protein